jgi:hypothetical protein
MGDIYPLDELLERWCITRCPALLDEQLFEDQLQFIHSLLLQATRATDGIKVGAP